ncbi:hypothetical protein [Streptomyces sp. S.PNR 29]|uniref:hypothetical protein n=1 Tax=Streptomyces sp. S.PNR 29 TaxID=2973805 RepID=UPI0025B172EA|nr:hypothetical protein [Streptomyces sp. S.PNR 29]MDN0193602.1 hypothetical protein [Streptomyces sp. S.PNR 29]
MPSEELRKKIQLRREETEAARLPELLVGVHAFGYHQDGEMPDWLDSLLAQYRRTDSVPDSRIGDEVSDEEVNLWIEEFVEQSSIGQRFYLRTWMEFFPWLECLVSGKGWVRSIREALGSDLIFVSQDKTALVVIFEEEYEYLGFRYAA